MKTIKQILKWYLIGITFAIFIIAMLIMVDTLKTPTSHLMLQNYHNIPKVVFGFGAFFGLVAYAGFGPKN